LRVAVNKELETARTAGLIGSGLQAIVNLYLDKRLYNVASLLENELRFVLITSGANLFPLSERSAQSVATSLEGLAVEVLASTDPKCVRCWQYVDTVGESHEHPQICERCITNVVGDGEMRIYA